MNQWNVNIVSSRGLRDLHPAASGEKARSRASGDRKRQRAMESIMTEQNINLNSLESIPRIRKCNSLFYAGCNFKYVAKNTFKVLSFQIASNFVTRPFIPLK